MWREHIRVRFWLFLALLAFVGCVSPVAPPAPISEIPDTLLVPNDLSIEVNEIQGAGGSSGMRLGSFGKLQTSEEIANAIEAAGIFEETNEFLNLALSVVSQSEIPVEVTVFNFAFAVADESGSSEVKFDFGVFDLDGNGIPESCTGCTCPVGCAPALAECPAEAPETEFQPICFRVWINGERFMAGVFNRVPTAENPQSGQIRVLFPESGDLAGSNMAVVYDHQDPQNLSTDLSLFSKDPNLTTDDFFGRRHAVAIQEGPEAQAKKTPRFSDELFDGRNSQLRFQAQYFSHLDFIILEVIPDGTFEDGLGLVDITPPICAHISSAEPISQVLCDDLGLALTAGNFLPLPELSDVAFPPPAQFPELPTF